MGIQFTGLASGLDTQSIIADLMRVERMKVDDIQKDKTRVDWKKDAWDEMNSKLFSFYKEELFEFKTSGTYDQKTVSSSNESVVSIGKSPGAVSGSHEIVVTNMARGSYLTGDELQNDIDLNPIDLTTTADKLANFGGATEINIHIMTSVGEVADVSNEITISNTDTLEEIITKVNDLGADLTINYDSNFNRIFMSSTETGEDVQLAFGQADGAIADELLASLGFGTTKVGAVGEDAEFTYNGTALSSSTNEVTVNNLSLTIKADSGSSSISVNSNADAIYDSVKSFITKYNEISVEINLKLGAESARGYDPLTSDEKAAMTDDEIELWEGKIKTSLLRNDNVLTNLNSTMRSILSISNGVDTSAFTYKSLSSLGIVTGAYTEKGMLHIEGDEDDSAYSLKTNRLKEAIDNDPDSVMELLSALGQELYETMADRMGSNTISSALTFYNDKMMDNQMSDYDSDMARLEERLAAVEQRYYKQFTAMEQAIQQSNSTGNWLAQQLSGM